MTRRTYLVLLTLVIAVALTAPALAKDDKRNPVGITPTGEDAPGMSKAPNYSPYAGRRYPTEVFWGDTHLHTSNSLDARGFGVTLGPEDAFRLARGDEVVTSHGEPLKLSRPLDWLVVADHSDGMGAMNEIIAGNPDLIKDPTVRGWHKAFAAGGQEAFMATMDVIDSFSQGKIPEVVLD
ncbi:MAG: DUF3604 domain-containing protein, partial [Thermoanaerobaculia bacterium]